MRATQAGRGKLLAASAGALLCAAPAIAIGASETREDGPGASGRVSAREMQQYCVNIAASVETVRLARQRKLLSEIETQLGARLSALEAKQAEVRKSLDQLEAFERKTNEALVAFYTRMKPDAAAAQIAQLDDDAAAALLLRLKAKVSGAILNEMEPARGAALATRIAQQRPASDGKRP